MKGWLVQKAKISLFLNQRFKLFSLPKLYYHHVQKVDMPVNILLSPPLLQSVQLTNVAPLSYVYLIILLLFKEKSGENYCKREGWTDDAPSQLNRDILFSFCVRSKP